jgi:hypothetical protein
MILIAEEREGSGRVLYQVIVSIFAWRGKESQTRNRYLRNGSLEPSQYSSMLGMWPA